MRQIIKDHYTREERAADWNLVGREVRFEGEDLRENWKRIKDASGFFQSIGKHEHLGGNTLTSVDVDGLKMEVWRFKR